MGVNGNALQKRVNSGAEGGELDTDGGVAPAFVVSGEE